MYGPFEVVSYRWGLLLLLRPSFDRWSFGFFKQRLYWIAGWVGGWGCHFLYKGQRAKGKGQNVVGFNACVRVLWSSTPNQYSPSVARTATDRPHFVHFYHLIDVLSDDSFNLRKGACRVWYAPTPQPQPQPLHLRQSTSTMSSASSTIEMSPNPVQDMR